MTGCHDRPQREELCVEFDPEVAELLLVGMVVTGTYNLLSDGTWCFTQVLHMRAARRQPDTKPWACTINQHQSSASKLPSRSGIHGQQWLLDCSLTLSMHCRLRLLSALKLGFAATCRPVTCGHRTTAPRAAWGGRCGPPRRPGAAPRGARTRRRRRAAAPVTAASVDNSIRDRRLAAGASGWPYAGELHSLLHGKACTVSPPVNPFPGLDVSAEAAYPAQRHARGCWLLSDWLSASRSRKPINATWGAHARFVSIRFVLSL